MRLFCATKNRLRDEARWPRRATFVGWRAVHGQGGVGPAKAVGRHVDAEHLARENKRLGRLLKEAKFRLSQACVEDIDYSPKRELDEAIVRKLATCRWVHEQQNVIVTGATGVGKTYVA